MKGVREIRPGTLSGMLVMRLMNLEIFMGKFWGNHRRNMGGIQIGIGHT
jgi:hypothetical protein